MSLPTVRRTALAGIVLAALSNSSAFAQAPDGGSGRATFGLYCASCHGTSGVGDGPVASSMSKRPANLTEIARRNGGMFPTDQVARIVDGRSPVKGHGGGEMPVWGDAFAKARPDGTTVEQRIRGLVTFIESIQAK
jgi:mono/diheme cytochrome c family protein